MVFKVNHQFSVSLSSILVRCCAIVYEIILVHNMIDIILLGSHIIIPINQWTINQWRFELKLVNVATNYFLKTLALRIHLPKAKGRQQ